MQPILLNSLNSLQARAINTREKLAKYFGKEFIEDFYLRSETFLENGKSSYEFQLNKQAGKVASKVERLLSNNDAFAPIAIGVAVKKAALTGGVESPGNDQLLFFADNGVFDGAAVGGYTEAACVQGIYNANLSMKADGQELIYSLDTAALENVPDFRFTATRIFQAGSIQQNLHPLTKEFVLFGGNDNVVTLDIQGGNTGTIAGDTATDSGSAIGATEQNKAAVIMYGLIIRGGADKVNHLDLTQMMIGKSAAMRLDQ